MKILKVKDGVSLSSTLDPTNSTLITPLSVIDNSATTGIIAYTGNFTGFSQFLLADPNIVLPVSLTTFVANLQGRDAVLNWATEQEYNNKGFDIQRSLNGVDFETIGFVSGRNSSLSEKYSYIDANILANAVVYYRLGQVDFDNKGTTSRIVNVKLINNGAAISLIWPNPASTEAHIGFSNSLFAGTITIVDQLGRKLISKTIVSPSASVTIKTNMLTNGMYWVQMNNGTVTETQKLIIKK